MESRTLALSSNAHIESIVNYRLDSRQSGRWILSAGIMNIAGRKVTGTDVSSKREIPFILADVKNTFNQQTAQTANKHDRVLRSTNTAAQASALAFISTLRRRNRGEEGEPSLLARFQQQFRTEGSKEGPGSRRKKNKYDPPILSGNLKWGIISDRWSSVFCLPEKHSLFNVNLETAEVLHAAPNLMFTNLAKIDAHE